MRKLELLIPAGSLDVLKTAVLYGADAVYLGGEAFGLRAKAKNFTNEEIKEGIAFAHERGVKVYITANIFAHNDDLAGVEEYFTELKEIKPDALIISDPGVFEIARRILPEMEIHISTQANNTNYGTFLFWYKQGAKRVVTARELSLKEIREIREHIPEDMEIESFIHGAMCISYSGRCLLSNFLTGRDANQGACTHPCRWKYAVAEETRPGEWMPVYENERGSQDANVIRTYLETVLELPWNKMTKDNASLKHAEEILEADHYGLEKVKERVLEYLAVRILTKKGTSPILCLVGPPGTGKTSIARSIAKAMGRKYVRISLGGVRDEAEIRGHRKTYVGAMPGRIVEGLKQAGVANPLMLLDEIDKVSSDYKGDTSSALLEVLDSEQNVKFRDHYVEIPIDLSEVLFIATANTTQTIPGPLLDRMELIEVNSYTENEKYHIAKDYLIPKQLEKNGLSKEQLNITGSALEKMIHSYTREAGVRNLERRVGDICRKAAREVLEKKKPSIRVTERNLDHYLGREKVFFDAAGNEAQVGIVRGLAWTSVGGDTLQIEVNVMPGKGVLQMTGQMGDVMKESAQIALTYVRSVASDYGVKENYFEKHDIHLHIPEGAVPKDGPSAGITMATAMLSAVTGRKVLPRVAMTGEVTLRGHVLMIGGLKEKLLAARMAQVEKVLVPAKNQPDVEELSKEITKGMEIVYIKEMNEVIREAFVPEK